MKGGAVPYIGAGVGTLVGLGGGAALMRDLKQKEDRAMFHLREMINPLLGIFVRDKFVPNKLLPDDLIINTMRDLLRYLKTTPMIKRVRFKWEDQKAKGMLAGTGSLFFFKDGIVQETYI